ncbi:hypothetical protein HBI70_199580 [Parastagonospora nodorum]|nr:hypothetical protein HBH61_231170 [Parastagonospora nodorum]KAH4917613.1 hypothetical protein HBI79_216700 [Parastagonospora nodorum]KAH5253036.1 hypothetical protein HBI70_199580 [Parastagonospora nodorum]KAH6327401.1 hypothetical protein HBI37_203200 [Parastagonospora nodorum]KAH6341682.1 hypothetical protein HBI36_188450 [Parastagonospora nodorum]
MEVTRRYCGARCRLDARFPARFLSDLDGFGGECGALPVSTAIGSLASRFLGPVVDREMDLSTSHATSLLGAPASA